jgi:DNA polymerase-3 subunit delta'
MFNLQGHEGPIHMLESAIRADRLHHAYLFTGPAHVGKMTLASQLAQAVNCLDARAAPCGECEPCKRIASQAHADVRIIAVDPEAAEGPRTQIGIEAVRDLIVSAHLRPYEGTTRVFIFEDAHRMSFDAGNALLKVLEEPPPDVLLLLLTDNADALPLTIRSRCQTIDLRPLPIERLRTLLIEEHGIVEEQAKVIAKLSRGCVGWAIEASRDPSLLARVHQRIEKIAGVAESGLEARFAYADELARRFSRDRAAGREELYLWLGWLRDVLLVQQGQAESVVNVSWRDTIQRHADALNPAQVVQWLNLTHDAIEMLERNANARLALEVLMLEAPALSTSTV